MKKIILGESTVAEAAHIHDLTPAKVELEMVDAFRSNPRDIAGRYEKRIEELQPAYGEAMLELKPRRKLNCHLRLGRRLILEILRR